MFAPAVPGMEFRVVIDATTASGAHIDPIREGAAPDFGACRGPAVRDEFFRKQEERVRRDLSGATARAFCQYFTRQWNAEHDGDSQILESALYMVSDVSPHPGQTGPLGLRRKLLTSCKPADSAR